MGYADMLEVPFVDFQRQLGPLKDELLASASRVIDSGHFILNREVEAFEDSFAKLCDCRHAVALNSGTDALLLVLRALGIGPGDEVITVPNSFVATAGAIGLTGATPRFVDVGSDMSMDANLLANAIGERTRAIIPVHLGGARGVGPGCN